MKKEKIYVVIDSEEKRLRAIQILSDAKESIYEFSDILNVYTTPFLLSFHKGEWCIILRIDDEINISLDQLEQILNPRFVVKDVILPIEELQKQAELHGWKLVKEERQIKVGDFGKFYNIFPNNYVCGVLSGLCQGEYVDSYSKGWKNFVHLTDEEKQQITENW
jgi:hypothetical protein